MNKVCLKRKKMTSLKSTLMAYDVIGVKKQQKPKDKKRLPQIQDLPNCKKSHDFLIAWFCFSLPFLYGEPMCPRGWLKEISVWSHTQFDQWVSKDERKLSILWIAHVGFSKVARSKVEVGDFESFEKSPAKAKWETWHIWVSV